MPARELPPDLREVEQDFPGRGRHVRERIALLEAVLPLAPHPFGPMPAGQVTGEFHWSAAVCQQGGVLSNQ
ncbi:MAG: hypothetical protein V5B39_21965 [Accumulibacter sp.]|jgi:hypothetical protein|uniref:hypothetical protein n=1 Tax=Accumulibacter sp. TaxID=2053492 RepID=UPI002FC2D5CF